MKPGNLQQLQGAKSGGVSDREMRNSFGALFRCRCAFSFVIHYLIRKLRLYSYEQVFVYIRIGYRRTS